MATQLNVPMNILQVGTTEIGGGAEKIVWGLFHSYKARHHGSWLAVGRKRTDDPDVFLIRNHDARPGWSRFWLGVSHYVQTTCGEVPGAGRLSGLAFGMAQPSRWLDIHRGVEDFHFPGTRSLLQMTPRMPDIVHLHNLHGGYFDLRVLPWLSRQLPVVVTLHDAWLLTGHCAHSFDCERWKSGCGQCPDLDIYPAIARDGTAHNWRRKREIYRNSRLYVGTPSRWLMQRVEQSIM